jgi:predicted acylesterase/phospholipase RssA
VHDPFGGDQVDAHREHPAALVLGSVPGSRRASWKSGTVAISRSTWDRLYVDGGVLDNLPISKMVAEG